MRLIFFPAYLKYDVNENDQRSINFWHQIWLNFISGGVGQKIAENR